MDRRRGGTRLDRRPRRARGRRRRGRADDRPTSIAAEDLPAGRHPGRRRPGSAPLPLELRPRADDILARQLAGGAGDRPAAITANRQQTAFAARVEAGTAVKPCPSTSTAPCDPASTTGTHEPGTPQGPGFCVQPTGNRLALSGFRRGPNRRVRARIARRHATDRRLDHQTKGTAVFDDVSSSSLRVAVAGLSARQNAIADNIANIETPGYQARKVKFEEALTQRRRARPVARRRSRRACRRRWSRRG